MIVSIECKFCYGVGLVHTAGHNGDPMDRGEPCPKCEGAGSVDADLEECAEIDSADDYLREAHK